MANNNNDDPSYVGTDPWLDKTWGPDALGVSVMFKSLQKRINDSWPPNCRP